MVNCHGVVHMEEEVQDRVQVEVGREEQGIGETHGKEQSEEQRENRHSINRTTWDDHEYGVMRTNTFLSHDVSVHHSVCALCRRKMTCEMSLTRCQRSCGTERTTEPDTAQTERVLTRPVDLLTLHLWRAVCIRQAKECLSTTSMY